MEVEPVNAHANEHCSDKVDEDRQNLENLCKCSARATGRPPTEHVRTVRADAHEDNAAEEDNKDVGASYPPPSLVIRAQFLGKAVFVA